MMIVAVEDEIFFIIGCPRSGTTFLNHIFREYLDIGLSNELQFIPKYYRKIRRYGNLNSKRNMDSLLSDLLHEPYFNIFEKVYSEKIGRHVKVTRESIIEHMPENSFAGVIFGILKSTAVQLEKKRVGNKHLIMAIHPDWLIEMFPQCKIIHIIRDGRDCALSLMKLRWGHSNVYAAAKFWSQNILGARKLVNLKSENRYIEIRYEDFLETPLSEMDRLKYFVGDGYTETNRDPLFIDLKNIVKTNNAYKWKEYMRPKDIAIFQEVSGYILSACGYELLPISTKIKSWQKWYYMVENQALREYKVRFKKDMPAGISSLRNILDL